MISQKRRKLLSWESPIPRQATDKKRRGLFAGGAVLALLIAAMISSGWLMRPSSAGWSGATNTGWYANNTASTDFYISTSADLAGLAELVNSDDGRVSFDNQTIHLLNDIDLESAEWTPIGNTSDKSFAGTFDGGGHKILNIKVTGEITGAGLFGYCASADVSNLTVTGSVQGSEHVGGVVGNAAGATAVRNCVNYASVSGNSNVGGIVGQGGAQNYTGPHKSDHLLRRKNGTIRGTGDDDGWDRAVNVIPLNLRRKWLSPQSKKKSPLRSLLLSSESAEI